MSFGALIDEWAALHLAQRRERYRAEAVRAIKHAFAALLKRPASRITKADAADFLQLVAATDRSKGSRGGLSMFLVDTDTPGVKIVRRTPTI